MTSTKTQAYQDYLLSDSHYWTKKLFPFIPKAKTLKIGNGLGYLSELIRPFTENLTIIDIETSPKTINKGSVQIYSGFPIPFPDKSFETTVVIFSLHHIPNSRIYFEEILRVTKRRIVIVEETYNNIFQKFHLFYRDWAVNRGAGQLVKLYWNSYFSRKALDKLIEDHNLTEVYKFSKRHKTYFKELFVLDLP